jgi:hypothetical protein
MRLKHRGWGMALLPGRHTGSQGRMAPHLFLQGVCLLGSYVPSPELGARVRDESDTDSALRWILGPGLMEEEQGVGHSPLLGKEERLCFWLAF